MSPSHFMHRILGLAKVVIGTGTSDRRGAGGLELDGLDADYAETLRAELLHRARRPRRPDHRDGGRTAPAGRRAGVGGRARPLLAPVGALRPVHAVRADHRRRSARLRVPARAAGPDQHPQGRSAALDRRRGALDRRLARSSSRSSWWCSCSRPSPRSSATCSTTPTSGSAATRAAACTSAAGLITTRRTSIEHARLAGVEVSDTLLLRLVGGARCLTIATGLRIGRGADRGGTVLLPAAPRPQALQVAADVLETAAPLDGRADAARRRRPAPPLHPRDRRRPDHHRPRRAARVGAGRSRRLAVGARSLGVFAVTAAGRRRARPRPVSRARARLGRRLPGLAVRQHRAPAQQPGRALDHRLEPAGDGLAAPARPGDPRRDDRSRQAALSQCPTSTATKRCGSPGSACPGCSSSSSR